MYPTIRIGPGASHEPPRRHSQSCTGKTWRRASPSDSPDELRTAGVPVGYVAARDTSHTLDTHTQRPPPDQLITTITSFLTPGPR